MFHDAIYYPSTATAHDYLADATAEMLRPRPRVGSRPRAVPQPWALPYALPEGREHLATDDSLTAPADLFTLAEPTDCFIFR